MIATQISTTERLIIVAVLLALGVALVRDYRRDRTPATAPPPAPRARRDLPDLGDPPRRLRLVDEWNDDEPAGGYPDLVRFPMTAAEAELANACIDGRDRYDELSNVTGSAARALLVLNRVRRERAASHTLRKAFHPNAS